VPNVSAINSRAVVYCLHFFMNLQNDRMEFHCPVVFSSLSSYSSVNGVQKITPSTPGLSYFSIDLLNLDWSKCCWSIRQDCSLYTTIVLLYPKSYQDSTVKNSVDKNLILSIFSYTFNQVFKTLLRQKVKLSTVPPVKT